MGAILLMWLSISGSALSTLSRGKCGHGREMGWTQEMQAETSTELCNKIKFFFLEKGKQKDKRQSEIIMANSLLNIQANSDNVIARAILKQFLSNLSHLLLHNLITVFPTQESKTPTRPSSSAQGL